MQESFRLLIACYVGVVADDAARSMREQKISSLISCEPGTSDITHVSSVLSKVSRQMGHVLLFTFLWTPIYISVRYRKETIMDLSRN